MGNFEFTHATREQVHLMIGLSGGTGSGKTMSAFRLARGLTTPGKRFAVIDTERGRAKHYADSFDFDWCGIDPPFRPARYTEAIQAAADAGYEAIIVDSASHEWFGEGGVLDWHDEEVERISNGNQAKRENANMAGWIKPKLGHKRFVNKLLQVNAHVILCFRAEPKIEMVKDGNRTVIKPKDSLVGYAGWIPVCEKNLPFELTLSFMLTADAPGIPKPIKLQEQHRAFVPLDRPVDEQVGIDLAGWAQGGEPQTVLLALDAGHAAADRGTAALQAWWTALSAPLKARLKARLTGVLKPKAAEADAASAPAGAEEATDG